MVDAIDPTAPAVSVPAVAASDANAPAAATIPDSGSAQAPSEASPAAPIAAEPSAPVVDKVPVTLLSAEAPPVVAPAEVKTDAPKPAEGDKPAAEVPKEEASQSDAPAPLPAYEPWTLPEGIKLDDKQSTEFNSLLGEFQNSTKAEQALVQKFGQTLIDKHVAQVSEELTRMHEAYQQAWLKQNEDWKEAFIKDPEIGGKRQETSVKAANEFITTHGGSTEQQAEFRKLMGTTGIGNHPAMIRMLANAMTKFSESNQPAPIHFAAEKQSKSSKWYGKKTG